MKQEILNNEELIIDNGRIRIKCKYTDGMLSQNELIIPGYDYNWACGTPFGACIIPGDRENPVLFSYSRCEKETSGDGTVKINLSGILGDGSEVTWTLSLYPGFSGFGMSASLYNPTDKILNNIQCLQPALFEIKTDKYDVYTYGIRKNASSTGDIIDSSERFGEFCQWNGWTVINARNRNQSLMLAGDLAGYNVTNPGSDTYYTVQARPHKNSNSISINAGIINAPGARIKQSVNLEPAERFTTPRVFVALAGGGRDHAVNAMRAMLRSVALLPIGESSPESSFNVWYTDDQAEKMYLEDLELASSMGFDAFTLDASWNEEGSIMPGSNDWSAGLGSYKESAVKFPHGMKYLSDKIHEKGMIFGLWMCPHSVDALREKRGDFPESFYAEINGERLHCDVQPLSLTTQLCLGNPEVVQRLKKEIADIVEKWHIDWIKWDPSATVSFCCNRSDHGHAPDGGVAANVAGRREIMAYLMERFPRLRGWECIHDMSLSRTNPTDCCHMLFPEYTNQFVTGPMTGPNVWGSCSYAFGSQEALLSLHAMPYVEVSYLDYFFRNIMSQGGFSMGNITGMAGQRLANAPLGFNDHFKRHIIMYKAHRHMFKEDIYILNILENTDHWRAFEYVKPDASEAMVFIFRDGGEVENNSISLKALDGSAKYEVYSQNERNGKEKIFTGAQLMDGSYKITLPHPYLSGKNWLPVMTDDVKKQFEKQLGYGSDALVIRRI